MSSSLDSDGFSEDEKLKELIREALSMQIETQKHKRAQKNLDSALTGVISEFLSSYIIMGFDFNGNPHTLKVAPTTQHNEALMSLLMRVFSREIRSRDGFDEENF
jgi:hypothetical protein